jgi:hypothetical protein
VIRIREIDPLVLRVVDLEAMLRCTSRIRKATPWN